MIHKLKSLLTKKDKRLLLGLFFFSIFISMIELIGISIIMPFMSVATNFELIYSNKYYSILYDFFSFREEVNFIFLEVL